MRILIPITYILGGVYMTLEAYMEIVKKIKEQPVLIYGCGVDQERVIHFLKKIGAKIEYVSNQNKEENSNYKYVNQSDIFGLSENVVCIVMLEKDINPIYIKMSQYFSTVLDADDIKEIMQNSNIMLKRNIDISKVNIIKEKYDNIVRKLRDDESKKILKIRTEYFLYGNAGILEQELYNPMKQYTCYELDNKMLGGVLKKIIIFGAGKCGKESKKRIDRCNKYNIEAFCDNNSELVGSYIDNIPVISIDDIKDSDSIVVIATSKYANEIYYQLLGENIDSERIVIPISGYLELQCGWQYFDVFKPQNKEIFLDVGVYNGNTIVDFYKWLDGNNGFAYGMEPIYEMYKESLRNIEKNNLKNVTIYNSAAWNKNETLLFDIDMKMDGEILGGSRFSKKGKLKVNGEYIDKFFAEKDKEVTYIKMYVEGSEMVALEGAKKTISKYKPKLAISVYHKPEDVLEIANYILKMVPEYNFILRHYTDGSNETVLYATVSDI